MLRARWEIRPTDGSRAIHGDLRAPRGPTPETVVVICHGFKGFKDWGSFPALARSLVKRGHAAISFNFSRSGVPADSDEHSDLEAFSENTHSRNVDEIRMVLDAITGGTLFPKRPRRIGIIAHSRGGGEAILATAEDPRVDALVTWAAIATVDRWKPEEIAAWERGETVFVENTRTGVRLPMGPGFWRDLSANRARLDILAAAERIDVPWLIAHGAGDETVAPAAAQMLFDAAGDEAELLYVEGAGHTFGAVHPYAGPTPELQIVAHATLEWFDRHLAPERHRVPVL